MSFRAGTSVRTDEDPALAARKLDWIREAGLHLMGHATYQEMAGFWPASDGEYAKPMNDIPKVVFSKTLTRAVWPQSTIATGDLADEISALKREPGKDMIAWEVRPSPSRSAGSAWWTNTGSCYSQCRWGDGLPLFAGLTAPFMLNLINARAYADGAVRHVYRPGEQNVTSG